MNTPIQIAFLGMPSSEPLATAIRDRSQALETHGARIIACHVSVELEGRHQTQGRLVTVRLVVTVAGHQLVISRCSHEDAYRAVHEAFDDMGRQLHDAAGRARAGRREVPAS